MSVSVAQQTDFVDDPQTQRAMALLLKSLQADMAAMKAWQDAHTHTALNTAPATVSPALNTTA